MAATLSVGLPGSRPLDTLERTLRDLQRAVEPVPSTRQRVGDSIQLLGQSASIGTTNLITRARNGLYIATVFVQVATADGGSAATVLATIGWTDRAGATTRATTALAVAALGRQQLQVEMQIEGDTNITYATTVAGAIGAARYALEIKLERIA